MYFLKFTTVIFYSFKFTFREFNSHIIFKNHVRKSVVTNSDVAVKLASFLRIGQKLRLNETLRTII